MNFNLLYIAMVIFSLLIVGLILTVLEFKNIDSPAKNITPVTPAVPLAPVGTNVTQLTGDRAA